MIDFPLDPAGYDYRPLKLQPQKQIGWDIYALQTGLFDSHDEQDGIFGKRTEAKVVEFQAEQKLLEDGIAGIVTQRKLCVEFMRPLRVAHELPAGLQRGQIEKESGWQVGNHSIRYRDGTFDCGPAQQNDRYTSLVEAFNIPLSLQAIAKRTAMQFSIYTGLGVASKVRAWELAAGHWNRPAYTDALARGKTSVMVGGAMIDLSPGAPERLWIEGYIERVTAYMR